MYSIINILDWNVMLSSNREYNVYVTDKNVHFIWSTYYFFWRISLEESWGKSTCVRTLIIVLRNPFSENYK